MDFLKGRRSEQVVVFSSLTFPSKKPQKCEYMHTNLSLSYRVLVEEGLSFT